MNFLVLISNLHHLRSRISYITREAVGAHGIPFLPGNNVVNNVLEFSSVCVEMYAKYCQIINTLKLHSCPPCVPSLMRRADSSWQSYWWIVKS